MNITVEYVRDGINKVASCFESIEEVENFIKENNLTEVKDPQNEGECRVSC